MQADSVYVAACLTLRMPVPKVWTIRAGIASACSEYLPFFGREKEAPHVKHWRD